MREFRRRLAEHPISSYVIEPPSESLDELIGIVANLKKCPICKKIWEIRDEENHLVEPNWDEIISDLREEVNKQKDKVRELTEENEKLRKGVSGEKTVSPKKTITKPKDFNENISLAAIRGDLPSIIYHAEVLKTNIELLDKDGHTPLGWAVLFNHEDIVKYLVENCKADPDTTSKNVMTPLSYALCKTPVKKEIVKCLVENGAKITEKDMLAIKEETS